MKLYYISGIMVKILDLSQLEDNLYAFIKYNKQKFVNYVVVLDILNQNYINIVKIVKTTFQADDL